MPMQYDNKTGVPRWVPDLGEEIDEGVTPPAAKITYGNKLDAFKGDKPLSKDEYEKLRNFDEVVDTTVADKLLKDVIKRAAPKGPWLQAEIAKAKPKGKDTIKVNRPTPFKVRAGSLDPHIATDSEVDEIEKQANARTISDWPLLRRLINRLRRAEG